MKKKVLIFGISDLAELLYSYLTSDSPEDYDIQGFVVEKNFLPKEGTFCGLSVYPLDCVASKFSPYEFSIFVCIGYNNMNFVRQRIFEKINKMGYPILSYIHPSSMVLSNDYGVGTIVFPNVTIDKFSTIGKGNIFYPLSLLSHHSTVGDFNFFAVKCCVCGHVTIHNNCFIGANSTIRNGVTVADKTLVGASSYISKNTVENGVYVPSRSACLSDLSSLDIHL